MLLFYIYFRCKYFVAFLISYLSALNISLQDVFGQLLFIFHFLVGIVDKNNRKSWFPFILHIFVKYYFGMYQPMWANFLQYVTFPIKITTLLSYVTKKLRCFYYQYLFFKLWNISFWLYKILRLVQHLYNTTI